MIEAKYKDFAVEIEKAILCGRWQGRLPGMIKLSKELKANPATISKAFKLLAAKGILMIDGTKGTYITRPDARTRHNVIGAVGIGPDLNTRSDEWSAMEAEAERGGYRLIGIAHNSKIFVDDMDLLLQFPVDGYIFMYSSLTLEIAAFLRQKGVRFVACSKTVGIPDADYVDFDSERIFETGMRHLLDLEHRRIAYVEFHNENYRYSERILNQYKRLLAETDIPFNNDYFISASSDYYYSLHGEEYLNAFGKECAKLIAGCKERPTAALITSPATASAFVEELRKHSVRCPEDISVVVYEGRSKSEDFFTNIKLDYITRARRGTARLIDLLDNQRPQSTQELLVSELIVNKSTKPPQRGQPNRGAAS